MKLPLTEKTIRYCVNCNRTTVQVKLLENGTWRCRECGHELSEHKEKREIVE